MFPGTEQIQHFSGSWQGVRGGLGGWVREDPRAKVHMYRPGSAEIHVYPAVFSFTWPPWALMAAAVARM